MILAEAGAREGRYSAESSRYGAAVRGGDSYTDVVIARAPLDFPHCEAPELVIALSQDTYDQTLPTLAPGTVLLFDPFFVTSKPAPGVRQFSIPATATAIAELGAGTSANLIMLGALVGLTGAVAVESLEAAVDAQLGQKRRAANRKALELGRGFACAASEVTP